LNNGEKMEQGFCPAPFASWNVNIAGSAGGRILFSVPVFVGKP